MYSLFICLYIYERDRERDRARERKTEQERDSQADKEREIERDRGSELQKLVNKCFQNELLNSGILALCFYAIFIQYFEA